MVLWIIALLLALLVFGSFPGILRALLFSVVGQIAILIAFAVLLSVLPPWAQLTIAGVLVAPFAIVLLSMPVLVVLVLRENAAKRRKRAEKAQADLAFIEARNEQIRQRWDLEEADRRKLCNHPASPP